MCCRAVRAWSCWSPATSLLSEKGVALLSCNCRVYLSHSDSCVLQDGASPELLITCSVLFALILLACAVELTQRTLQALATFGATPEGAEAKAEDDLLREIEGGQQTTLPCRHTTKQRVPKGYAEEDHVVAWCGGVHLHGLLCSHSPSLFSHIRIGELEALLADGLLDRVEAGHHQSCRWCISVSRHKKPEFR